MKKLTLGGLAAAVWTYAGTAASFASGCEQNEFLCSPNQEPPVPEINAMAGLAAVALLAAVVALVWERRRRAA